MRRNHFLSEKDDLKNLREVIKQMLLMLCMLNKYNSNCEKQVILLMIPNRKEWQYVPVKSINIIESNNV